MIAPLAASSSDTRHEEAGGVTPPLGSLDLSRDPDSGPLNDNANPSLGTGQIVASPSANLELASHSAQHLTPQPQPLKFDPQRRAVSKDLKGAVASVTALLEQREAELMPRKRARKASTAKGFLLAIESLVCNLAFLKLMMMSDDDGGRLSVPRSNAIMYGHKRYRSPVYGQHFLDALDLMLHPRIGLIEQVGRGYHFARGPKQQGTVRPTAAFNALVPPVIVQWDAFSRAEDYQPLVLMGRKDRETGKAERIDYTDTGHTRRLRMQVKRINAYLREAPANGCLRWRRASAGACSFRS